MRLIDADVLIVKLLRMYEYCERHKGVNAATALFKACDLVSQASPTIDAVQVVRCKDCGYVGKNTWADGSIFCAGNKQDPNNYCSRGIRKDGVNDG